MNDNHMNDILTREFLHRKELAALNTLLTGEISAVEAYNLAIQKIKNSQLIPTLEECRDSHAIRVAILQDRSKALDENPRESSGWWGMVARFVEGSAGAISDRVAMSVLAAGEDYGFSQYEQHMKDLDAESFAFAEADLLPAQGMTLQKISLLCAFLRSETYNTAESEKQKDDEHNTKTAA